MGVHFKETKLKSCIMFCGLCTKNVRWNSCQCTHLKKEFAARETMVYLWYFKLKSLRFEHFIVKLSGQLLGSARGLALGCGKPFAGAVLSPRGCRLLLL